MKSQKISFCVFFSLLLIATCSTVCFASNTQSSCDPKQEEQRRKKLEQEHSWKNTSQTADQKGTCLHEIISTLIQQPTSCLDREDLLQCVEKLVNSQADLEKEDTNGLTVSKAAENCKISLFTRWEIIDEAISILKKEGVILRSIRMLQRKPPLLHLFYWCLGITAFGAHYLTQKYSNTTTVLECPECQTQLSLCATRNANVTCVECEKCKTVIEIKKPAEQ